MNNDQQKAETDYEINWYCARCKMADIAYRKKNITHYLPV
jgi:hypothetical protein